MAEENPSLPLADIPEELEHAELAALLDFFRDNAARFEISVLKEQALETGYRDSIVERAIAEFEKDPRPEPEPPREPPEPQRSLPAAPPPKAPVFLEQLAKEAPAELSPDPSRPPWWARRISPGLAFLVVAINAVVFSMLFNGHGDAAMLFYCLEFAFALFLARLGKVQEGRMTPPLQQQEQIALPVQQQQAAPVPVPPEPSRTAVPTRPHEAPTEKPAPQRGRGKTRARRR